MKTVEQLEAELRDSLACERQLREALQLLYSETADYITINYLGDVHHNRSMQLSRDALAHARKLGMEVGE